LIVIDASIAAAWLLNETDVVPAEELLGAFSSEPILVPPHWPTELGNAFRKAVRTKRVIADDIDSVLRRLALLDLTVAPPLQMIEISPLIHFALDLGLSVYDASYVRLAAARQVPLATLDTAMKAAARKIGVATLPA
jgi:predicted nucleic acid-binding protein